MGTADSTTSPEGQARDTEPRSQARREQKTNTGTINLAEISRFLKGLSRSVQSSELESLRLLPSGSRDDATGWDALWTHLLPLGIAPKRFHLHFDKSNNVSTNYPQYLRIQEGNPSERHKLLGIKEWNPKWTSEDFR